MKFVKVLFNDKSGASNFHYKIGEENFAEKWNPNADNPKEFGGFNFSTEESIIRWLVRGDTLYDVVIPKDAEVVEIDHPSTPHGVFRSNKIILLNPRKITDEMAMELYKKSTIPEKSYYKALAGLVERNHLKTADLLISEKINKNNIDEVLEEYLDFYIPQKKIDEIAYKNYYKYLKKLQEIKEK